MKRRERRRKKIRTDETLIKVAMPIISYFRDKCGVFGAFSIEYTYDRCIHMFKGILPKC